MQPGPAAAVSDPRHHARHPQAAKGEEHQDAAGLLQSPHRAGAGPPGGSLRAFWRLGARNSVLPGVSCLCLSWSSVGPSGALRLVGMHE